MPAKDGAEALVPPTTAQPSGVFDPSKVLPSKIHTPVLGLASKDRSGVPRVSPTTSTRRSWKLGRGSTKLGPPPASCQALSSKNLPVMLSREMVVPPAHTTFGDTHGYCVPGLSPAEATYTTPDAVNI